MNETRTGPLQDRVEEVFIVDRRESTARGMWKSPDQSENVELDTGSRLNQTLRGDRGAGGMRQEVKRRSKESRGPGERMAELAGL